MSATLEAPSEPAVPPTLDPKTADDLKRFRQVHTLGLAIQKQQKSISSQETDVAAAKSRLEDEKEILADLNRELRGLQEDLNKLAAGQFVDKLFSDVGTAVVASSSPATTDAWRGTSVEALGLKAKTCESLVEGGIETVGKLADYTAGGKLLIDIKGIGKGKVQEIDDAMEKFWIAQAAAKAAEPVTSEPAPNIEGVDQKPAEAAEVVQAVEPMVQEGTTPAAEELSPETSVVREDQAVAVAEFGTGGAIDAVQLWVAPRRNGTWATKYDVYVGPEVSQTPNRIAAAWVGSHGDQPSAAAAMLADVKARLDELRASKRGQARTRIDSVLAELAKIEVSKEA